MGSRILLLSMAMLAIFLSTPTAESRLIQRIDRRSLAAADLCQRAEFPKLCYALTSSLPNASPQSLTVAAIKEAMSKAAAAMDAAARLRAAPGTEKVVASCLDVCQQNFSDTMDDLQAGLKYLTSGGSHSDVMTYLSAAVTDTETCNDAFDEEEGAVANPVAHVNVNLQKLVKNSLALADSLK